MKENAYKFIKQKTQILPVATILGSWLGQWWHI